MWFVPWWWWWGKLPGIGVFVSAPSCTALAWRVRFTRCAIWRSLSTVHWNRWHSCYIYNTLSMHCDQYLSRLTISRSPSAQTLIVLCDHLRLDSLHKSVSSRWLLLLNNVQVNLLSFLCHTSIVIHNSPFQGVEHFSLFRRLRTRCFSSSLGANIERTGKHFEGAHMRVNGFIIAQ